MVFYPPYSRDSNLAIPNPNELYNHYPHDTSRVTKQETLVGIPTNLEVEPTYK